MVMYGAPLRAWSLSHCEYTPAPSTRLPSIPTATATLEA